MNPLQIFDIDAESNTSTRWVSVQSDLEDIDGKRKEIDIELLDDDMPRAVAFFDIDETLAHLSFIHSKAIQHIFPEEDPRELEETFYRGFKLGNSFREFDRMKGIYTDGYVEWKDPEIYIKNRLMTHQRKIDEPGNLEHDVSAGLLKEYGQAAARIADEIYTSEPEEFEKLSIQPILVLARMYAKLGVPMVGFTANARALVQRLAKYLKLADLFVDIASDEDMDGGGKEIAISLLIKKLESKGLHVPTGRLIFVGDSIRGDIGSSLITVAGSKEISGIGILVLKDKNALIEIKKEINKNADLRKIVDNIDIYGLMIDNVPTNQEGEPLLLSRFSKQFLEKL